jgi:uncharacterized protein YcgI (DUF1989 family)
MIPSSLTEFDELTVAPGAGRALDVRAGDQVDIIALEGPQVADMWAFAHPYDSEFLSTEHTRSCLDRLCPQVGQAFYTNKRRPMLKVIADTSPGDHDLLLSACDTARYRLLGHQGPHRTCADNLIEALASHGQALRDIPSPVNVFENVAIGADGSLEIRPPRVMAGQALSLIAEMDLILVVSACPMDIVPTNGADRRPKPIGIRLRPAGQV